MEVIKYEYQVIRRKETVILFSKLWIILCTVRHSLAGARCSTLVDKNDAGTLFYVFSTENFDWVGRI